MEIHVTLGPACLTEPRLIELLNSGVSAIRLNMSYVNEGTLHSTISRIRQIAPHVKIGADIRGRKLRIGTVPGDKVTLRAGQTFRLYPSEDAKAGAEDYAYVSYPHMCSKLNAGAVVLLDDGAITLTVMEIKYGEIACRVETDAELTSGCGVNTPGCPIELPPLSAKDYGDIECLSKLSIDFVYLSYVERASDITILKETLRRYNMKDAVVAKVELAEAVKNLEEICAVSDEICIARGDLGVEVDLPKIPYIQRHIVKTARQAGKPVLLAGEVMLSLVNRYKPYRAELTDVIAALEQGVDGFILSDETAIGVDPANAVRHLQALIREHNLRSV
ncbi:pyruvate kinase [Candidatus Magnetominusculus dajiuhuensis]|uniref:pyruvate kinase n=1 Tax=Candidatus Magnetominusculus dajiuhuensis TaxID=3137712 RepID=UPI003B431E86